MVQYIDNFSKNLNLVSLKPIPKTLVLKCPSHLNINFAKRQKTFRKLPHKYILNSTLNNFVLWMNLRIYWLFMYARALSKENRLYILYIMLKLTFLSLCIHTSYIYCILPEERSIVGAISSIKRKTRDSINYKAFNISHSPTSKSIL